MPHEDDPRISGKIVFYRRIPPGADRVSWDDTGTPTPASQNFRDHQDELSVHMAHETTPDQVLQGHPGFGLVQFTAEQARDILGDKFTICRDPEDPANGHVLICGNITGSLSKKLRKVATWVEGRMPQRGVEPPS